MATASIRPDTEFRGEENFHRRREQMTTLTLLTLAALLAGCFSGPTYPRQQTTTTTVTTCPTGMQLQADGTCQ
jgi:hypothetical protein